MQYKELKEKSRELENKYQLTHYELLQRFMFERILERISVSEYKHNFILKGGLLLSAMFGINNRTTQDMDATIQGLSISKEEMSKVLNSILKIDLNDGVELNYDYPMLFENRQIHIYTYNMETILSEKIETILRRGVYNSRMKDYYDIHIFLTRLIDDIDIKIFKEAVYNTFTKRAAFGYLRDYKQILNEINDYDRIKELWNVYSKKNIYAVDIKFGDIVLELKNFLEKINIEELI